MADDLSAAPQTGASEAVSAPADTGAPSAPAAESKAPSARDAIKQAFADVETRHAEPNETNKAAAVLKNGAGADDQLVTDTASSAEASERAKKGWETRRQNEAKAAEPAPVDPAKAAPVAEAKPVDAAQLKPEQPAITRYPEAPSRFSPEAKAAWKDMPEAGRAEVHRAVAEMEQGIAKHKEGADRWTELAEYDRMAKSLGTDVKSALKEYVDADNLITNDPVKGIDAVLKARGYDLKEFCEHVLQLGDNPTREDPRATAFEREIAGLKKQLAEVTGQVQQQVVGVQQQHRASIDSQVNAFKSDPAHSRFAELENDMAFFIQTGKATNLKEAYDLAERLNPAPRIQPPAPAIPASDLAAQTRRGQASVTGAPGMGSNPATKRPASPTAGAAVRKAFSDLGLTPSS